MGDVVRVGGDARRHAGELAGDGLAQHHRAGRAREPDAGGIGRRSMAAIDRRAHLGRLIGGVDDVLDADRDAVQRSAHLGAVELARLAQRQLGIDAGPGVNVAFARVDARQAIAHHRLAGGLAGRDRAHDLGRGELVQLALRWAGTCFGLASSRSCDAAQFLPARAADVPAILPNTAPEVSPEPPG